MADIVHYFPIAAPPEDVFPNVSTPEGLDRWWTKTSAGTPALGETYTLDFGPGYVWKAGVTLCHEPHEFELTLTEAHEDWLGSRVRFELVRDKGATAVRFRHLGWPAANPHYHGSNYCWAMYLRILKRWLEHGETVPYENRLDV